MTYVYIAYGIVTASFVSIYGWIYVHRARLCSRLEALRVERKEK